MKNKKTIDRLQHDATTVRFPSSNQGFGALSRDLCDVVMDNLSETLRSVASSRDSWQWNGDAQEFVFDVVDELKTWVGKKWVHTTCTRPFSIDPVQSIADQIAQLTEAIGAWRDVFVDLYKLQLRHIKETQGADALIAAVESA